MFSTRSYEGELEAAHHQNNLLDSINNRALDFRRGGLLGAMDKVQAHDEDTLGSGSGSGLSDLSAMENETDEFGRLLLQHQRDARRMNNATRGGQQAFRKARPHPRITERLTCEERERNLAEAHNHERSSSGGSNDTEPPLNPPKEWGRHARKQRDWLKKITAPSENGDDGGREDFNSFTGHMNMSDVDEPVRSIEMTPPSMQRGRGTITPPSSLRHMNTTLRPLIDSEDQDSDFTSNSFLTSTPAQPKYRRKIDDMARREIEELETQAVTTRALDQIDQHSPNAVLRHTSSQRLRERAAADGLLSPSMSPTIPSTKSRSPSRIPVLRQNGIGNKENLPLHNDGNAGVKGSHVTERATGIARPLAAKQLPRPTHHRNDSMSLLRRLARVSSMSPSPARERDEPGPAEDLQPIATAVNTDQRHARSKENGLLHDVDETPLPQDPPVNVKTPVVTGAWVDTTTNADTQPPPPQPPKADSEEKKAADSVDDDMMNTNIQTSQPKSALDAIVREAKAHPEGQTYGESTIQSLEDIVHPNMDQTDTSMNLDLDRKAADPQEEAIDGGRPLTQAEKDRRQEQLAMEAMNQHLRTARTSIKDANRGLRRVENKIETVRAPAEPVTTTDKTMTITRKAATSTQSKHGHVHCDVCGGGYHSVWKALYIELRSCFYTYDSTSKYGIRLTYLGLSVLLWIIWYISEYTLCEYYCYPYYAPIGKPSPPLDPEAPDFPFVIPTLLLRPFKWLWKPLCDAMAESLEVAFNAYFGDSSAAAEPHPVLGPGKAGGTLWRAWEHTPVVKGEWLASATAVGARVGRSVLDVVDEAESMWGDQLLG